MRVYEVNPENVADVWGADLDGVTYRTGARPGGGFWALHSGRLVGNIADAGIPEWDVYLAVEDTTPTPQYHTLERIDLAFVGNLRDPAARVHETRVFVQLPIDQLYAERQVELDQRTTSALLQGVRVTSLSSAQPHVDCRTDTAMLLYYLNIDANTLPNATQFSTPDLYNAFFTIKKNEVDEVITNVALLQAQALANSATHAAELDRLRDVPDWPGLAAYDLTVGWPPPPGG